MKKLLLILLLFSTIMFGQTYIGFAPALTNDIGKITNKANISFEIGKQYDCFSIGIDFGKTTLNTNIINNTYLELRPNLNVFQQGKYTGTFTCGAGYIFNDTHNENYLIEFTQGVEYSYSDKIHINIYVGTFYYSGEYTQSNSQFFGISIMKYFLPYKPKSLIEIKK